MNTPRAPLWSRSADSLFQLAVGLFFGGAVATLVVLLVWTRSAYMTGQANPIQQPIAFDHRHHTRDDGIDCRFCHASVDRAPLAGVPPTQLCMGCHAQVWTQAPILARVRESFFTRTPIEWIKVTPLPDHVKFDHSIHVTRGVACVTCHGRVDRMAQVYQAEPMNMGWCLSCHRNPAPNLRPPDLVTEMEWNPERDPKEIGKEIAAKLDVRPPTHCTGCHR